MIIILGACYTSITPSLDPDIGLTPPLITEPTDSLSFLPDSNYYALNTNFGNFFQTWVHSYEEDDNNNQCFRPITYKEFPPSRFRQNYIFNSDGSGDYLYLHPSDMHHMRPCFWRLSKNNSSIVYLYTGGKTPSAVFEIVSLSNDKLLLHRIRRNK